MLYLVPEQACCSRHAAYFTRNFAPTCAYLHLALVGKYFSSDIFIAKQCCEHDIFS